MIQTVIVRKPQSPEDFEAYYLLRYEVLRKPWAQPPGSEKDDNEEESVHAMACNQNGDVLGVCRLQMNSKEEAQLRFMGVKANTQGTGVGRKLIHFMEEEARQMGASYIILQARENAVPFYEKCGYKVIEKTFLMWGEIQHYLMKKSIS